MLVSNGEARVVYCAIEGKVRIRRNVSVWYALHFGCAGTTVCHARAGVG